MCLDGKVGSKYPANCCTPTSTRSNPVISVQLSGYRRGQGPTGPTRAAHGGIMGAQPTPVYYNYCNNIGQNLGNE